MQNPQLFAFLTLFISVWNLLLVFWLFGAAAFKSPSCTYIESYLLICVHTNNICLRDQRLFSLLPIPVPTPASIRMEWHVNMCVCVCVCAQINLTINIQWSNCVIRIWQTNIDEMPMPLSYRQTSESNELFRQEEIWYSPNTTKQT